jgi:transposase
LSTGWYGYRMTTVQLTDEQWAKLRDFLRSDPHAYLGTDDGACRRCVEVVLWIDRSGAQWRLLPTAYGNWKSLDKRFARWCDLGVWERMLVHCANDPDMEHGILDSTIVRAHPCAAGAEKNGTADAQALGRSRGGVSTQIHILVDGLGNPLRVRLTAGQCHASPPAPAVLEGLTFARVLADRGYAGQAFIDLVVQGGAAAVIPAHQRAKQPRDDDRWW